MASCIARWEWRTFGESVPDVESRLRSVLAPPRTSSELYLVVPHADLNLKVRDGVLELKELVDVSAEGLERWMPTIKAPFPLGAAVVARLSARLRISTLPEDRKSTRLNSSHMSISYAVFCLKKKKKNIHNV